MAEIVRAIDVSTAQRVIDWASVYQSGIKLAWIKASEGASKTKVGKAKAAIRREYLLKNADLALKAGLGVGAYHFARLGDVALELASFESACQGIALALTEPAILDIEPSSNGDGTWSFKGDSRRFTTSAIHRWVSAWVKQRPHDILYGYRSFLDKGTLLSRLKRSLRSDWPAPLFVATRPWGESAPPESVEELLKCQPQIPWVGWQYASKAGRVPGIDGAVDLSLVKVV